MVLSAELEKTIAEMVSMGFDRAQAVNALRAAYNNPERAIEYLLSGNIPQVQQQVPPHNQQQGQVGQNPYDLGD